MLAIIAALLSYPLSWHSTGNLFCCRTTALAPTAAFSITTVFLLPRGEGRDIEMVFVIAGDQDQVLHLKNALSLRSVPGTITLAYASLFGAYGGAAAFAEHEARRSTTGATHA